ncbi:MAG: VWA domain-containing protein [Candidatus Hydrogenedentes bacterium]|nr:VWA domain-containing protein [Candidatus Hydrogenedentota bacterium]
MSLSLFPRFVFPWALMLLALVPWSIWLGAHIRSLSSARKWTAIVTRVIILLCLIGALAGAELVRRNDKLAVFFLLDHSNSVPESVRLAAAQAVRNACDQYMTYRDEAGVIVFGEESSIETSVVPSLDLGEIQSFVGGEQTDLAGAIRLALAAFPQGYMKRMVVFSDGNETRGAALEEVKIAQAAGVGVDVIPLNIGAVQEIKIKEVSAPNRVNAGEPFQLRVVATAEQDCEATLRVYQTVQGKKYLMKPTTVTLQKGDNAFLLPQELSSGGFYEYEVTAESSADTVLANNEGRAFTVIQGEPRVLYVEADPEHSTTLGPALEAEGLNVVQAHLGNVPASLSDLQNFNSVVLSDVSSTDLTSDQLKAFEAMVRDLGIGLVMIGGPNSYGAGGYLDTPVERALPLSMDIKQRKVLPRGALVLILHTCEIPDGNAWAREIGLAALNVLSSQDLMGALGYLWNQGQGEGWFYELQPVGDKGMMRSVLSGAQPGDMPDVATTLQKAYDALKNADAAVKRVVIISDGDPARPSGGLLSKLADAKIAVSTVCIAPHSANDEDMLKWVAQQTGGNYYLVTDPRSLPQIFTKEAAVVKKGVLVEEEFTPRVMHDSELLTGLLEDGLPMLRGYVVTTPKENATVPLISHEDDPVLAHWRYGLGKSVAFTSDVTSRWAADWLNWPGFNRFWAQAVRWSMREVSPSNFRVETSIQDGKGHVQIDAVDEQGKFVNFLQPRGVVIGPGPDFKRQDIELTQTGPGIYEAPFPVDQRGVYMLNLTYTNEDGSQGMIPAGLALSYSREYEYNTTNRGLLEQLAAYGGGKIRSTGENPFEHNLATAASITPIWHWLVALAACLFPFEIFVRRVVVDFRAIYVWFVAGLKKIPGLGRMVPMPTLRPAPVTGTYATAGPAREFVFTPGGFRVSSEGGAQPFGPPGTTPEVLPGDLVIESPAQKSVAHSEYTRQLLAAKKRALERESPKRGPDSDENKEKP